MDYLIPIVLALFAQAAAESGVVLAGERPALVGALALAPIIFGFMARRAYLTGRFRIGSWWTHAVYWSPPALHALAVCACGWLATIDRWSGTRASLLGWPTPSLLFGYAPFVVYAIVSIEVRVRASNPAGEATRRARRFHLRMLFAALVPMIVFALGAWIVGQSERVRVELEEVGAYSVAFVALAVLGFVVALPWVLRASWDTRKLEPGPVRELLEALARRANFRYRDLLLWRTGDLMANAAVVGSGAHGRLVLFSDALIAALSPRELIAVFAHEIGHAKRRHVLIFLLWSAAVFIGIDLIGSVSSTPWITGLAGVALFAFWYFLFGWLSRRYELEADLYALQLTGDPESLIGALDRVGSPHTRALSSWRHFSTERRADFILRAASDVEVGAKLTRQLKRLAVLGVVLALVATGFEVRRLARTFPVDRIAVALRLGEFELAEQRLAQLDAPDPHVAALVHRASQLRGEEPSPARLEARARTALEAGDLTATREWLELAAARGADGLDEVLDLMRAYESGASNDALERLRAARPEWTASIEAFAAARAKSGS